MPIENKFKGIRITSDNSNNKSKIVIRRSFNPLKLGGPIAIVNCGECKVKYKTNLFFLSGNYLHLDEELVCKNGHKERFSYEKVSAYQMAD